MRRAAMIPALAITCLLAGAIHLAGQAANSPPYLNPDLPPERRAADIVSRMTLEEKVLQMQKDRKSVV